MAAEKAISSVVLLLGDLLIQKVNFLRGVEGEVQLLIDELNRMQSFLRDANKKQAQDNRIRNWISDIRKVALDAEDAIEMFNLNVEDPAESKGLLESCACFPIHVRHLHRIGKEIKSIRARLDAIDKSRERYGIKDLGELGEPAGRSEVEARRRLAPWHKDEHLVGVEDDVEKLLKSIMDEDNKGLSVTAVVGMGGIGKSTLAREVYNHPAVVSGRFDCRAWVVVTSEFSPQETIKQLILETASSEQEKQEQHEEIKKFEELTRDVLYLERKLGELLHRRLNGKTYFIVVDDVWEKEHLYSLMTAFPKQKDKASRLLLTTRNKDLTTRNKDLTTHCQSLHEMMFLNFDKSWELFLKKSLIGGSSGEFPKELEPVVREIVKKCQGLPLAITVMGGLLAQARCHREWEKALNELNSHILRAENSILVILEAILELSYHNLSPQLKSCFMCLAFFKEDATIPAKRLVNIMVGLGLIQSEGRTMEEEEEIARGYLDDLIKRNVVQIKDMTLDNRVKSCHVHDSLRNICLHKAEEEIYLEKRDRRVSLHKHRHCVVQWDDLRSFSMDQRKPIRSLFLLNVGEDFMSSCWKSFQQIKTLDLNCDYHVKRLPDSLQLLLGLKQLRIHTKYNCFIELPMWLNALKKLELLDMGALDVQFPKVELEMDSLRYIHANNISLPFTRDGWENVETLKYVEQEYWMTLISRATDDFRLRELGIVVHRETPSLPFRSNWPKNLVKLHFLWHFCLRDHITFIPRLTTLTKLKLEGLMRNCPIADLLPPNLLHLTLEWSYLDEDPMEELGQLPKLLYLKLKNHSYTGKRMRILYDGFPSLRGLRLQSLVQLRSVVIEKGGMPQLKLLQIDRCQLLDTRNMQNKSYQLQILGNTI